ncbi:MAG: hypothetical protein ACP5D9_15335, partial [Mariniphaga sp.]
FSRDKNRLFENDFQARHFHSREKVFFLLPLRFPEWLAMPGQRAIKNHCITGFRSISGIGILFFFITVFPFFASSQEISNVRVIPGSEQVNIHYDLAGKGQTFKVDLFYSVNDGQTWEGPLKRVSGDVGAGINPGTGKKITWDVQSEPGIEEGYMQFMVIAETAGMPVSIQAKTEIQKPVKNLDLRKYKTGKAISLTLALASAGTGVFAYLQGNKLYDEYKTATGDVADLRSKIELYDTVYPVAFAVAGASAVSFIIYSAKHGKAKKELTFQPVPLQNGGGLAVSLKF